jgi:glyoxalase family protein
MEIEGLHHITLVASNAQRTTDFYTQVLGLRLVKQTVNFDDPGSYHLYFGNAEAAPGSLITFFEWPEAPRGAPGIGGTHHLALTVADGDSLLRWKRRLTDLGHQVYGPYDRHYFVSLYFRDPDGQLLELATQGPGFTVDEPVEALGAVFQEPLWEATREHRDPAAIAAETWPEAVPAITPDMALVAGMHHLTAISADLERTHRFYHDLLGLRRVKMTANFDDPTSAHWYWGREEGRPGTLITYFERDPAKTRRMRMGAGQTHHLAFSVRDEATQVAWRESLLDAGVAVSPVRDRVYFKSIYTQDPDGHIIELATRGPGFFVDESPETLGTGLQLPPWLEPHRDRIAPALVPLAVPAWPRFSPPMETPYGPA